MPKAIWNGVVIAESEKTVKLEGNHYFPENTVNKSYLKKSEYSSVCPWKGTASYYNIEVDGQINADAAWSYRNPSPDAKQIEGHIAFWKGVEVVS